MTMQQAEAFVARVQEDSEFADRLAALKDNPAAAQALIAGEGFDATPDEIREAFMEAFGTELSEEQLASIAGGMSDGDIINSTLQGVPAPLRPIATAAVAAAISGGYREGDFVIIGSMVGGSAVVAGALTAAAGV